MTSPAGATYSIVATDQGTGAVGGAVTSCVHTQGVTVVYGPAPGKGGINAQAAANANGRDRGVELLNMGVAPADIITQITATSFDPSYNQRQYGVADLQGRAAAFTGTGTSVEQWRGSKQGTLGTYTYSVQGNVLTGAAVVDQAEAAFRGGGCDLPEKLMLALEGGAQNGQGDRRCINDAGVGVPGDASSIEVDLTGQTAGSYLRLSVATNLQNGVTQLRSQFNTWRQTHPCLQQDGGTPDAGPKDASVSDATADNRGGDVSTGSDASDGSAGTGGTAGSAGQDGSAGNAGTAGTGGAAGTAGTGGAAGTGTSGSGGATGGAAGKSGAAGTSGTGGTAGTGTGGTTGTGGSGGATGGTTGSGGASGATAGTSATGGRGGSGTTGSGGSTSDDGGCSCRIGHSHSAGAAGLAISGLALIAGSWRRSKRRRTAD
jgi:uncharacterized Ntn-hydrolase superfamily protein